MRVVFNGVRVRPRAQAPNTRATAAIRRASRSRPTARRRSSSTSVRGCGRTARSCDGDFNGSVLLTHLHWDHVQGLPFFTPLHREGATVDIYGPRQADGPLGDVFTQLMQPPFFPIQAEPARGRRALSRHGRRRLPDRHREGAVAVGAPRRTDARLPRRLERTCRSRTSPITARAAAPTIPTTTCRTKCSSCATASTCLIHDAQHTHEEYAPKRHWGHCTVEYAVHVARESGARRLALFHHDPAHGDDALDEITEQAGDHAAHVGGPEVIAAYEGLELALHAVAAEGAVTPQRSARSPPDPADVPHGAGSLRDGRHADHRDERRRAGRHGVQLVHVGVARPAARAVLRGEVVEHVAADPSRGKVGGEHPRRRRRRNLPAVCASRASTASRTSRTRSAAPVHRYSTTRSRSSTARRSPNTTPATTSSSSARSSSSDTRPKASRCSSTAAGTAGSRSSSPWTGRDRRRGAARPRGRADASPRSPSSGPRRDPRPVRRVARRPVWARRSRPRCRSSSSRSRLALLVWWTAVPGIVAAVLLLAFTAVLVRAAAAAPAVRVLRRRVEDAGRRRRGAAQRGADRAGGAGDGLAAVADRRSRAGRGVLPTCTIVVAATIATTASADGQQPRRRPRSRGRTSERRRRRARLRPGRPGARMVSARHRALGRRAEPGCDPGGERPVERVARGPDQRPRSRGRSRRSAAARAAGRRRR